MIAGVLLRIALMLLCGLAGVLATTARADAQQFAAQQYGPERGLLNLGISCLQQDRAGFLLVCTENGIFRFDGQSFLRYGTDNGLPDHGIGSGLHVTPDGHILVVDAGTVYVGADRLDPHFTAVPGSGPIESDASTRTTLFGNGMLVVSAGRVFVVRADEGGVFSMRPFLPASLLQRFPALHDVTSITASGGTIWLGCADGHLCRLQCPRAPAADGPACSDVRVFGPEDGVPAQDWAAMLVDRSGTLWARAPDIMLVHRADGERFEIEPLPGGVGRYAGRTYRLTIAQGPRGRIVTQGPSGLLIREADRWKTIDRTHGLVDGEIAAILFDHEGSLWLGIRGQGLFRALGFGEWENWTTGSGLSDNVCWQLARQDSGPLRIATDQGVNTMAVPEPHAITQLPLDGPTFTVAVTPSGRVWSAGLTGLLRRYSPQTGRIDVTMQVPVTDKIALDRAGGLLLATSSGLFRLPDPDAPLPAAPVLLAATRDHLKNFALDPRGRIWLFTDGSLTRIDPTGREPRATWPIAIDTPPRAMAFAGPDNLWFGSDNRGLQRIVLSNDKPGRVEPIAGVPLPASLVLTIARDHRGWMWIGTDRGLDVWNGRAWQHLDQEDGLLSDDMNQDSILSDADGSMWFGTGHGLSHLLDVSDIFTSDALHPVITETLLDGVPIRRRTIPWSPASLTIRFSALDFRLADAIRFRYRMDGVDRDWVETSNNTVRYPVLPYGHLVFRVEAVEPIRHRVSTPVTFTLKVRPPWWATLWFRLLAALVVIAAATATWRLRVRLLMVRQRQLETLVESRTAEIARAHATLQAQAAHDGLTGLLNRVAITAGLEALIADPAARDSVAVVLADVDHFKSVNDRHGHFGGDEVLRQLSCRLTGVLTGGELAGRYGGEEFVLVLPGSDEPLQRLRAIRGAMVDDPVKVDEAEILVSCSFGLSMFRPGDTCEAMLRRADRLLYQAKETGRDRIVAER